MSLIEALLIRGRRSTAPAPPVRHVNAVVSADDPDDAELLVEGAEYVDAIGTAAIIVYQDSKGVRTERRITIRRVYESSVGRPLVGCHCHERDAYRLFRVDRIQNWIDVETGEIIEDFQELWPRLKASDEMYADDTALERSRHGLNVLMFLARCDGEYHHTEMDAVSAYILDRCFDLEFDDELLMRYANRLYPDHDVFESSVRSLAREQEHLIRLARYVERLIAADGEITPEEHEFATAIREAIKSN